jgi:predicted nucleic acid-binding protein
VRLVVDTGVFSASLSKRRRAEFEPLITKLVGHQLFLGAPTVAELRFGAINASWGPPRRLRIEQAITRATVIPVSDTLLTRIAELRYSWRAAGHALADRTHTSDLWIAASAIHIGAPLVTADSVFVNTPGLNLA